MINRAANHNKSLEVGGFGHLMQVDDGQDIIIDDIYIPPQIVQGAHTDIDVEGLDALMAHAASLGQTVDEWRLWWHSHANMGAFASGQDEQTLFQQAEWFDSWAIGLTVNTKGERFAWINTHLPFRMMMKDLPVGVYYPMPDTRDEYIDGLMKEVKARTYSGPSNPTAGRGTGSHGGTGNSYGGGHPYNNGSFRPGGHPAAAPNDEEAIAPNTPGAKARAAALSLAEELGDHFVETAPGRWEPRWQLPISSAQYRPFHQFSSHVNRIRERNKASATGTEPPNPPTGSAPATPPQLPAGSSTTAPLMDEDPEVQKIREKLMANRSSESTSSGGVAPSSGKRGNPRTNTKLGRIGDARNVKVDKAPELLDEEGTDPDPPHDFIPEHPYILTDAGDPLREKLVLADGILIDLSQFHRWSDVPSTEMADALKDLGWEPRISSYDEWASMGMG